MNSPPIESKLESQIASIVKKVVEERLPNLIENYIESYLGEELISGKIKLTNSVTKMDSISDKLNNINTDNYDK